MMRFILTTALAATLTYGLSSLIPASIATASELDNETGVTNSKLQGTLVLRVDTRTHETSFAQTPQAVPSGKAAKSLSKAVKFAKVPAHKMKSELDQDGGASSWYFYQPYNYNYYRPHCYWYGNYYAPYYTYSYGYYNYYYYSSWWSYGY
jgi:hypothetical protein